MNLSLSDITLRPIVKTLGGSHRRYLAISMCFLLGACQATTGSTLSNFGLFEQPQSFVPGEDVVLPKDAKALTEETDIGSTLKLVVELDRQKQFNEARHLMGQVRNNQPLNSNGFRVSTNSMALLALKGGDFDAFMRLARQLDVSLSNPIRVDKPHVEVITLYRVISGKTLPVNAPQKMRVLAAKYGPSKDIQVTRSTK